MAASFGRPARKLFPIANDYISLNNGSYGLAPIQVIQSRQAWSARIDSNPDLFIKFELNANLDAALASVAGPIFGQASVDNLVFVNNSSTATTAVLNSLRVKRLAEGKKSAAAVAAEGGRRPKVLHLSTGYSFVAIEIAYVCAADGFEPLTVVIQHPIAPAEMVAKVEAAILAEQQAGGEVAIASAPGVVQPFREITAACRRLNVPIFVDGAHAAGQIPLTDLSDVDPDGFVTNLHKWLHAPRGCAVLYLSKRLQPYVAGPTITRVPTALEPTAPNVPAQPPIAYPSWRNAFMWPGTQDFTAFLCVPAAVEFRKQLGGEDAVMRYCHSLAIEGGRKVAAIWGTEVLGERLGLDDVLHASYGVRQGSRGGAGSGRQDSAGDTHERVHGGCPVVPALGWSGGHPVGVERWRAREARESDRIAIESHGGWGVYNDVSDFEYVAHALKAIFTGQDLGAARVALRKLKSNL
ncbi:pyridoxal phosphate-dependent transferase [Zopfochytrium polystomum]|nr:pyridoxal phosphate-dependent transferase [Zopfochytrium polystomum]